MTEPNVRVPEKKTTEMNSSRWHVLLLALLLLTGCSSNPSKGYSFASTYPEGVRTVTIPVFDNRTYYPGLEVQLTEAVIKQVQASSGLKVVSAANADSRLIATITDAQLRRLTLDKTTGLVQEQAFQLTIDFEWRDARSGKVLMSRKNFAATDTFVPARPTGERIETAQHGAIQRLARDVVAEMRASW
ncbi:MAG TPA: LPS assembly lipoprotein LptE [Phycisphaerales bacterium]|nr:LPS assembly lipoprotein LptE [Phycisphaerales bacterium]